MSDGIMCLQVTVVEATDEAFVIAEENGGPSTEVLVEVPDALVKSVKLTLCKR